MSDIGLDGNNAPAEVDRTPWPIFIGITGRAFTSYQREWLSDDWGMGLDDYAASDLSAEDEAILDDRVSRSLADFDTGAVGIRRVGTQLVITAEVRA